MLLTVSKRLEFCASRRLALPGRTAAQNRVDFGAESAARYGTGRNYVAWFVLTGTVDEKTGMLVNISEIKRRAAAIVDERFDHKFLNADHPAFREAAPTAENIARQLLQEALPAFAGIKAELTAVHLRENRYRSATVYASGATEANHWFEFSAARQTMSPHLSQEENEQLFGAAASPAGHGHHYRARITFRDTFPPVSAVEKTLLEQRDLLDHKNLNQEVPALRGRPITTESLARWLRETLSGDLPVCGVRLHERDDFFAEAWPEGETLLGLRRSFSAAHRLHSSALTEEENRTLYDKCNNELGHGHTYVAEATIRGPYDERTGTVSSFDRLQQGLAEAVAPWEDRHLDLETDEFRDHPSTGENIVRALWEKVNGRLDDQLVRLRLWETANNRFTLRRS